MSELRVYRREYWPTCARCGAKATWAAEESRPGVPYHLCDRCHAAQEAPEPLPGQLTLPEGE